MKSKISVASRCVCDMPAGLAFVLTFGLGGHTSLALAGGMGDKVPDQMRQIPPPGITVSPEMKIALEAESLCIGGDYSVWRIVPHASQTSNVPADVGI